MMIGSNAVYVRLAVDYANALLGAAGGAFAVFLAWMLGKSDSAQKRTDDRTREVIELTVGKSLSEINGKIDTMNANFATFAANAVPNVVRQSIESAATVIYETADKMIELKKRDRDE